MFSKHATLALAALVAPSASAQQLSNDLASDLLAELRTTANNFSECSLSFGYFPDSVFLSNSAEFSCHQILRTATVAQTDRVI